MALPKLNTPTYELVLPSTGEKIKFRPFLVREQKVLMVAQESNEEAQIASAVGDLVKSCTFGKVDNPDNIPTFDLEYMFLMTRAKSVGSSIKLNITCPDDGVTEVEHEVLIDDIQVIKNKEQKNEIMLTDDIGVTMRYPTMNMIRGFAGDDTKVTELSFSMIKNCIVNVFDKEQVYDEMSEQDLDSFIEQMNTSQFEKISDFFDGMPKLSHTIEVTNPNTGVKSEIKLEGLQSFLE